MASLKKVLACILCLKKFSEQDVEELNYFPNEGICFNCYLDGSKKEHRVWCFGKKNIIDAITGKIKAFGYDPAQSPDCRRYCPDRKICYLFATNQIQKLRLLTKSQMPFKPGSISSRAFAACIIGTTRLRLKRLIKSYGGSFTVIMKRLKRQKLGTKTWKYIRNGVKIRIKM